MMSNKRSKASLFFELFKERGAFVVDRRLMIYNKADISKLGQLNQLAQRPNQAFDNPPADDEILRLLAQAVLA